MNEHKKIYVNGGVAIYTPFFCYKDAGAGYKEPPVGAEIMECDDKIDGCPCIKITAEKVPSIFNEYYAKTFFLHYINGVIFCINLFSKTMTNIRKIFWASKKCLIC